MSGHHLTALPLAYSALYWKIYMKMRPRHVFKIMTRFQFRFALALSGVVVMLFSHDQGWKAGLALFLFATFLTLYYPQKRKGE